MRVFISGGCKNGKSSLAEAIAGSQRGKDPLWYIATMIPRDEEDRARIRRHVAERAGKGFETLECGTELLHGLASVDPAGAFLLDSVTALLSNEMFFPGGGYDPRAGERVAGDLRRLAVSVKNIVFVSDYLYCDAGHYDDFTETYRRALAECDAALAETCDTVVEVFSGNRIVYKGDLPV
jgi:adenosylcobinamide kinase/adenosylcobinamide-phosphate guanylyltransferase